MMQDTFMIDGGTTTIKCSNCGQALASIWVMRPNLDIQSKIIAECCFCGDKSFTVEIKGQFATGHVDGVVMIENILEDITEKDGIIYQEVLIKTEKEA